MRAKQRPRKTHRRDLWLLTLLLILAFGLRIAGLAAHNIWWDEGIGVWLARMPAWEIVQWTAGDVHPPIYYLLLRGWRLLAGEGAYVLRFPSALFSLLTVAVIYRLGRELDGSATGLMAALLLTLSRFAVGWAQEIRMYSLAALWSTGALYAALRWWRRPNARAWWGYVATTTASLLTLYLTAPVPLVANLGFAVVWQRRGRKRRPLIRWLMAQVAVLAVVLPWLAYALPRMHSWESDSSFSPSFFVKLYTVMLTVGSPLDLERYLPWAVAVVAVMFGGLIAARASWRRLPAQTGGLVMLLSGLLLPALFVYAVSLPTFGFIYARPLVPRYLLPLSACFYALLAWAVVALLRAQPWLGRVALALVVAVAASGLWSFYPGRARRDDYAAIALALEAHRRPEDAVVLYVDRDWPIFVAHYPGDRRDISYGAALDDAAADAFLAPLWEASEALWLVTTPEALQADPRQTVPRWLDARAVASETVIAGENSLTFYARTEARAELRPAVVSNFTPPIRIGCDVGAGGHLAGASIPLPRYRTGDTLHLALTWAPPPDQVVTVEIDGPAQRSFDQAPPAPIAGRDQAHAIRQQFSIPIAPDLPGGRYQVTARVSDNGPRVSIGTFAVIQGAAGAEVNVAEIPHQVDYQFGSQIHLIGYKLSESTVAPGEAIGLTLYWQTDAVISERYKVFTHLLGEVYNADTDNFLWGQQDNEPVNGQSPTTRWQPGAIIVDPYHIPVDPDAPPGRYRLEVGLYGLIDGQRLPVTGGSADQIHNDAVILTEIEVRVPQNLLFASSLF